MNVDILFVVPSRKHKVKEESIGSLILAKKAQLAGYKVKIVRYWDVDAQPDINYEKFSKAIIQHIISQKPSIVSFYCRCEEYHICIDLARQIKLQNLNIIISFGGPQAELVAKQTLEKFSYIDYVCCSEGENTIIPFLNSTLKNNKGDIQSLKGLTYRNNHEIYQNVFPDFLDDDYVRDFNYYDLIPKDIIYKSDSMPIDVGRGCPFSCTFCSTKNFWKQKFRLRNIKNTIDEIEYVITNYDIKKFDFKHDLFTVNKRRIIEFCTELENRELDINWSCDSRIDTIDKETIDVMVKHGLYQIFFGVETGSYRMQQVINKRLDLTKCEEIVKYCIDKGLKVTTSFIYGFPDETESDLDATLKMIVKFQNYGCTVLTNLCHILNGTELYYMHRNNLRLTRNTAFNDSIIAFNYLFDLISQHQDIFASFCDLPTNLREEMKYIDVFRYAMFYANELNNEQNDFLLKNDYASFNMYKMFCLANKKDLSITIPASNGDPTNSRHVLKHLSKDNYQMMIDNLISHILNRNMNK